MKIGLSSFVYFNYSLEEAIRRTAEAGFDAIDIWGGRPHAYRQDLRQFEIQALKTLLKQCRLSVASLIPAQFRYPTNLCVRNENIRRDSVAYIQDALELASELNAPVVSVCPGHTLYGQAKIDAWARLQDSLTAICERARRYGIRIALEPADAYETDLMNTVADAMRMVNELNLANLGVLFDTGHGHVLGETIQQAVQAAGDRLFHIHVDDNQGSRDQHLIPGEGTYDFQCMVKTLKQSGYQGVLSAELGWDYTLAPDQAARETAGRMRSWFATSE